MVKGKIAIGADIGGSHISTAAIDIKANKILKDTLADEDVNNKASREVIIDSWISALRKTIHKIDIDDLAGIGFAMPGPFNYETGVALFERVEKYEGLFGVDVGKELHDALSLPKSKPIRFMNDATAFAVGEAWMGKSVGYERSLAITLGTGFGSAFVENGLPVVTGDRVPDLGCVWHLPFNSGIADDYISTRWFINSYREITGKETSGVKELADLVNSSKFAKDLFVQYGQNLGRILSPWIKRFGVEVLVIGGNISAAYSIFGPYFNEIIQDPNQQVEVKISTLKENAAIIGSARLVQEDYWIKIQNLLKYM